MSDNTGLNIGIAVVFLGLVLIIIASPLYSEAVKTGKPKGPALALLIIGIVLFLFGLILAIFYPSDIVITSEEAILFEEEL